jgi:tRNA(Arg) A34 adenosine deaminase TadA
LFKEKGIIMRFKGDIRDLGARLLGEIDSENENVINWKDWLQKYRFSPEYPDDLYAWITDVIALRSVNSGNYGVGSIMVDSRNEIVALGQNLVFSPTFRGDLHAEMVALNHFEEENPQITNLKRFTFYTSLEPCPMCLIRLISSGINRVHYVASDPIGGMVNGITLFPPLWKELSEPQLFKTAQCSLELSKAAIEIMLINAEELLEILRKRRSDV